MIIKESEWIWNRLSKENRPVVLYGMGDGAEKILALCEKFGVKVQDIFASDEFVRGQSFAGFLVKRYSQICALYENPVILVAFGTEKPEILEHIYVMEETAEVLAPDVPLFGHELADFSWLRQHRKEIQQVYDRLADEVSRKVFQNLIIYKLTGKIELLRDVTTPREEALDLIFPLDEQAVYIDLGAYDGDTLLEFREHAGEHYQKMLAWEPDRKNYMKLERNIEKNQLENVQIYPYASWSHAEKVIFNGCGGRNSSLGEGKKEYQVQAEAVDNILQGEPVSYIKMDVEGAEYQTLLGCRKTIETFAPKLAVSAYHRTWDFVELPLLLWHLNPGYQIFLRHHPYIPAWETNLYVINSSHL